MHIERLYAERFRNLDALEWRPHRHFNLVTGDNGQGKTNLLEAVTVAAGLRSFRTAKLQDCVQFGHASATVALQFQRQDLRSDLAVQIGTLGRQKAGGRKLFVDGKPVAGAAEYLGRLVVVLFAPSDLHLPHAEPAERRRWLDRVVFHHAPAHLGDLRQYEKVLSSRNALLKQARQGPCDLGLLDVYDGMLAHAGAAVAARRAAVVQRFGPILREVFAGIAAPGLHADLAVLPKGVPADLPDAQRETALLAALRERRKADLALGYTTRGPHRDEVELRLQDRPAHLHASQGQARALVLAMKIAEIRSLEATLGEPPVLLMDDVSSELDARRNRALMTYLDALGGQVILTTTDPAHIRVAAPRQVFLVQQGDLTPGPAFEREATMPVAPPQP